MAYITRDAAARRLSISKRTLDRYILDGRLPVTKFGRLVRILHNDLDNLCTSIGRVQR